MLGNKTNTVYFSDDTATDKDEWVATNVIVDQGRSMQVWRHAKGRKRIVWVVIPVHGGYVVVKVVTTAKRSTYEIELRKARDVRAI